MALEFSNVEQYVNVPDNALLRRYQTDFSLSCWLIHDTEGTSHVAPIFSNRSTDSGEAGSLWYIRGSADAVNVGKLVFDAEQTTGTRSSYSSSTISTATVHNVVTTFEYNGSDTNIVKHYIDGALDRTTNNVSNILSGTHYNAIGTEGWRNAAYTFDGKIWDLRQYNRVLSANEIAEIYHKRGADRVWQGLVGWWRLDELPSGTPAPVLLDSMDSTSGWSTDSTGVVSLNSTTYVQGSGALNLTKNQTTKAEAYMFKKISSVNVTGQNIKISAYIKDQTTLDKLTRIQLYLHSALAVNHYFYSFTNLSVGWNELSAHIDDFGESGTPDKTDIQRIRVDADTNNTTDTWAEGDVIFDFYRAGDYVPNSIIDLSGNGNHGTPHGGTYQASPHRLRRGVLVS